MKKYVLQTEVMTIDLESETYDDAISELYEKGYVNCGTVRLIEVFYQEISHTPFMIDTGYGES